ncbi:hypothetical protein [Bradyrhizobium yuanmingense]|uniref:hypothetical protein n=1 Tax=Bradyrhizobium yuanmingense TaxID=108015 RepID=UPI001CD31617|nr:hypothetical protein [Bradyrhizobium yuanmingense]MCA1527803.1 hypothetical protein [Bradyrhizobium yuanmingense]
MVKSLAILTAISLSINAATACEPKPAPKGATEMGFNRVAFDVCPKKSDISMNGKGNASILYNGVWWTQKTRDSSLYSDRPDGSLSIALGGAVATVPTNMVPGLLPLLNGDKGFFVEFETYLSDDDPDHWPAVWLMPIEHNAQQQDSYPPDDKGYERWLEIDVDEGGFTPGPMATSIAWEGKWPNYKRTRSNPNLKNAKIDRTQRHRFGAGFDPRSLTITFWHNDTVQYVASGESVPEIARKQHFYLIMNAASRRNERPYSMNVVRFRAFVPR